MTKKNKDTIEHIQFEDWDPEIGMYVCVGIGKSGRFYIKTICFEDKDDNTSWRLLSEEGEATEYEGD